MSFQNTLHLSILFYWVRFSDDKLSVTPEHYAVSLCFLYWIRIRKEQSNVLSEYVALTLFSFAEYLFLDKIAVLSEHAPLLWFVLLDTHLKLKLK